MAWRLLMRRCPSRSMTVVGDLDQRGSSAGPRSWAEVLEPYAPARPDGTPRWRVETLTVNYRTPEPIMALATEVARARGLSPRPVTSAREGNAPVVVRRADADAIRDAVGTPQGGRLAVIASPGDVDRVVKAVSAVVPVGRGGAALDSAVAVLTVASAKGLEFDDVVIVEPARILAESSRGAADLYVAMTRATSRLVVLDPDGIVPAGRSV